MSGPIIQLQEGTSYILVETDADTHKMQSNGPKLKYAIEDFIEMSLRKRLKYSSLSEAQHRLVTEIREELLDHLEGLI